METLQKTIFKKSSQTFYYSTIFFPKHIQKDVHKLYAFVRVADDFVDSIPQDAWGFYDFKERSFYYIDNSDQLSSNPIISGFVDIYKKYHFKREWVESFLWAMESDLSLVYMKDKSHLEDYMYGSAGVVGYMMCAIFSIHDAQRLEAARMFAYSLQTINFIRDVDEDNMLQRKYLYNINHIQYQWAIVPDDDFPKFIDGHMHQYFSYYAAARHGLCELPFSFRIAVMTAGQIYNWTARKISACPQRVFREKIKPSWMRVVFYGISNSILQFFRDFP